jgi:hypothetical protein
MLSGKLCTLKSYDVVEEEGFYGEPGCSFCEYMRAGPCGKVSSCITKD